MVYQTKESFLEAIKQTAKVDESDRPTIIVMPKTSIFFALSPFMVNAMKAMVVPSDVWESARVQMAKDEDLANLLAGFNVAIQR